MGAEFSKISVHELMKSDCSNSDEQNLKISRMTVNEIDSLNSDHSSEVNESTLQAQDDKAFQLFNKENTTRINIAQ